MQATSVCRTCDAPIFWGLTINEQFIPMDPEATPDGNCWIACYRNGQPVVLVASAESPVPSYVALRYQSHWASCPRPPERQHQKAHEVAP